MTPPLKETVETVQAVQSVEKQSQKSEIGRRKLEFAVLDHPSSTR